MSGNVANNVLAADHESHRAVSYVDKMEEARARRAAVLNEGQAAANLPLAVPPKVPMLTAIKSLPPTPPEPATPETAPRTPPSSQSETPTAEEVPDRTFTTRPVSVAQMSHAEAAFPAVAPKPKPVIPDATAVAARAARRSEKTTAWLIRGLSYVLVAQVSYATATLEFGPPEIPPQFAPPLVSLAAQPLGALTAIAVPDRATPIGTLASPHTLTSATVGTRPEQPNPPEGLGPTAVTPIAALIPPKLVQPDGGSIAISLPSVTDPVGATANSSALTSAAIDAHPVQPTAPEGRGPSVTMSIVAPTAPLAQPAQLVTLPSNLRPQNRPQLVIGRLAVPD